MKVRCIDNKNQLAYLILNKTYEVLSENENFFTVKDEAGEEKRYYKTRFEVGEEKEEFTFKEVIARIQEDEEYICTIDNYDITSISNHYNTTTINFKESGIHVSIYDLAKFKLKKKIQYMTFLEAKEKGIPKHKDYFLGYLKDEDSMKNFIEEMDKKVWSVEE